MSVVLIVQGVPTPLGDIIPTPYDGQYLLAADIEADGGTGVVDFTTDLQQAQKFDDMQAAIDFIHQVSVTKPRRLDGKPNRPLTSTNWELKTV